jgi:DNA-binding Lrp family transcriptional regulator
MSATDFQPHRRDSAKRNSLRSTPLGAVWPGLPARDRRLLLWLQSGDIVTARLAAVLAYGSVRTAQRRLARLHELGIVRGFWAANNYRPRGRHAYVLTRPSRLDLDRLVWPEGRPRRGQDMPPSSAIHQLATHDLLAAFLQAGDPSREEGIFAWVSERPLAGLFEGYLRPDAFAGVRVGGRGIALFVERDLGTERGEDLPDKIARYLAVFARAPELVVNVGFVVETARRAHTIHRRSRDLQVAGSELRFVTAIDEEVRNDPLGALWTDGDASWSTRDLPATVTQVSWSILVAGCLAEPNHFASMDERAIGMVAPLRTYLVGSARSSVG